MIKELEIKRLETKLRENTQSDDSETLKIQIRSLTEQLKIKQEEIGKLEMTISSAGLVFDEGDVSGMSARTKMKRHVYRKIEHLNEYIRKEVTDEIHARYEKEISQLMIN